MSFSSRFVVSCSLTLVAASSMFAWSQPTPAPLLKVEPVLVEDYRGVETPVQKALPYEDQRGTGLDGSLRSEAPFGWVVNANPFAHDWNDKAKYRDVIMLQTGRYSPTEIDLALPAPGFSWTVGRTYTVPEDWPNYAVNYQGPKGHQGLDWHQFSQPEIVLFTVPGTDAGEEDFIYLVYGADRFVEFKQVDPTHAVFRGVNGAGGAIVAGSSGIHDTLTYWDQHGTRSVFFDPRDADNEFTDLGSNVHDGQGQLWTITDAAGNQAYVGHQTDPTQALEFGYDDGGRMLVAYDTANRKYEYTYTLIQDTDIFLTLEATLLTKVEVFEDYDLDSIWETTGSKVEYTYFTELEGNKGIFGNLEEVHITMPLSGYDSASPALRTQTMKQRYWYHTNNTNNQRGYFAVKVNSEGYRRFENEQTVSIDAVQVGNELKEYRELYVYSYYDWDGWDGRIKSVTWPGQPYSLSPINFDYENYTTFSNTSSYDPEHQFIVEVKEASGGLHFYQYFDEAGQPLTERVKGGLNIPDLWTFVDREDPAVSNTFDGMIRRIARPLSIDTFVANPSGGSYTPPCTIKSNTSGNLDGGPVEVYDRDTSTTSAFRGFRLADQWQNGGSPFGSEDGPHSIYSYSYLTPARDTAAAVDVGGYLVIRPLLSVFKQYPGINVGAGMPATEDINYAYEFHAQDVGGGGTTDPSDPLWLRQRKMITTLPVVSTSQLGSGVAETSEVYRRVDGTLVFARDESGVWDYIQVENDLVVKEIEDVDLGQSSAFASGEAPSDYIATVPSTPNAYHLVTEIIRDEIGRPTQVTTPDGDVQEGYHSAIASGELTEVWSAKSESGTHTGPAIYYAYDHLGVRIVDAEIAFAGGATTTALSAWVDDTANTPLVDAIVEGELSKIDTRLMDPSGSLVFANREYHTLPLSDIGIRRLNYDEQWFEYDSSRRIKGTAQKNGTINETAFDAYGYPDTIILNSYDPGEGTGTLGGSFPGPGGDMPGTCPENCCAPTSQPPGIMGIISWYMKGCGNQPVLNLGVGEDGVSYAQNDFLGRARFIIQPDAPHEFREHDNLGRLIAVGMYKDIPFTVAFPLPTESDRTAPDVLTDLDFRFDSPKSTSQYRTSLIEYEYTPRGQLWKIVHHEVNQTTGILEDSIQTVYGYDESGRTIYADSGQATKSTYNRLGQLTDSYTIAVTDDVSGSYSDLFDVDGDIVVSEQHVAVDPETGNTHLHIRVDREPDISGQPQPVGKLDENDYRDLSNILILATKINGRAQIVTYDFDTLDRVVARDIHGTGNTDTGSNFDPASPPSGALSVSLTYGDDGRIIEIIDELGRTQTRSYDVAGKLTEQIDNYVLNGTAADENRKTQWEYRDTQLYKYIAFTDDTTSQVTTYDYGSPHDFEDHPDYADINPTNDVLRSIVYPDGKEEMFFYNNFESLSLHIDRHGNEIKIDFDGSFRPQLIELIYAKPGSEYLSEVGRSIQLTYDDRGNIQRVEEVDTNGSAVLSTVSLEYDNWGAMSLFKQQDDWLDTLVGSSIVKERAFGYTWESSSTGSPSSLRVDEFGYLGDTGTGADDIALAMNYTGSTNNGLSRVTSMALNGVTVANYEYLGFDRVSKVSYPENDVYSNLQNTSNNYDALDRFNRVVRSRWNRTRASNEVPFYDNEVHWDAGSNVTGITDHVFTNDFNFKYINDQLDRLTQSQRGAGTGTVITTLREQADWNLGKTGTHDSYDLDLNGDLNYSDAGEFQADNSFDGLTPDVSINQLTTIEQDTDNTPGYENTYARTYDENGNLKTAPDRNQNFKWDYLGRLTEISADDDGTTRLVAEFKYNALGYRIAERLDSNGDGYLDKSVANNGNGDDTVWRRLIYDAQWRVVEVYEVETAVGSQSESLVERHVHHAAGLNGLGTGSYIDLVVLRDRDADGNGSLEERHYYAQNWRADVVAVIDNAGNQVEQTRYSAYGVPYAIPFVDQNLDGAVNFFDITPFTTKINSGVYDVTADANLDGTLNLFDISYFLAQHAALTGQGFGRDVQSAYGHNRGYTGYWFIPEARLHHIRKRWYNMADGGWLALDPIGYADGANLYQYARSNPAARQDPTGEIAPLLVIGAYFLVDGVMTELAHAPGEDSTPESRRALEEEHDKQQIENLAWEIGGGVAGAGVGKFILKPLGSKIRKTFCQTCFVAGTAVATLSGTLPIESVEVGDVVKSAPDMLEDSAMEWSTNLDLEESSDPNSWEQIDPDRWSLVEMRVDFSPGVYTYIKALRPNAWVDDLKVGDHVGYYREGVGVMGDIEILSISDCPDLPANTVGVVRATYETHGVGAVDLWLAGSDQPIGVTTNHLVYSLDREAWVEVGELWLDERLRTASGEDSTVRDIALHDGERIVYNLEVHGDHTYYVGEFGLWAHNGMLLPGSGDPPSSIDDLPDYESWPSEPVDSGKGTKYTDPDNKYRQVREMNPVTHKGADPKKRHPDGYTTYSSPETGKVHLEGRRSLRSP